MHVRDHLEAIGQEIVNSRPSAHRSADRLRSESWVEGGVLVEVRHDLVGVARVERVVDFVEQRNAQCSRLEGYGGGAHLDLSGQVSFR